MQVRAFERYIPLSDSWLIISVLFRVEIFSLCVFGPKIWLKSKKFAHESHNPVEHRIIFPQLFINKGTSVHNLLFYTKIQAWYPSLG